MCSSMALYQGVPSPVCITLYVYLVDPTTPTGEECAAAWPCTKEYRPLCVLHKYANGSIATKSFSNPCEFAKFKKCNNEDLEVLYMGNCMESEYMIHHTCHYFVPFRCHL